MEQNEMFDEEKNRTTETSEGDELEDFEEVPGEPKKSNIKLLLGIAFILIAGAYAASTFLSNKGEEAPETDKRIPIKAAPVTGNVTQANIPPAEPSKEASKTDVKAELKKPAEEVAAKKQEAPKPKEELKNAKPAPEKAARRELKKKEHEAEGKKHAASVMAKKESAPEGGARIAAIEKTNSNKVKTEELTVVIGTYVARYEVDAAMEKLKGSGIDHSTRQTRKKLLMNRLLVRELKDKDAVKGLVSDLKASGYEPFTVLKDGTYKVYAVSNYNKETSRENKADLEKLGYHPVIVPTQTMTRVFELVTHPKDGEDAKALTARLEKLGFRPEIGK